MSYLVVYTRMDKDLKGGDYGPFGEIDRAEECVLLLCRDPEVRSAKIVPCDPE